MTPPLDANGQPNSEDDLQKLLGSDPLKWLESLAARQGANPEEFITSADLDIPEVGADVVVDEPGYVDYDAAGSGASSAAGTPSRSAAQPAPAAPSPEPMSGEVNPLAWLESLARRQGANPEEFVTDANLDIPEVAADVTVSEPGYTPYQAAAAAPPPPPPVETPAPPERELTASEAAALLGMDTAEIIPVRVPKPTAPLPPLPAAPEPVSMDPLGGVVDPLAWLESLARRQGANPEELITSADLDVPIPAGAAVDEPGYVDYAPFPAEEAAELPGPEPVAVEPPAPEPFLDLAPSANDTLAWLEGLAAEQGAAPPVVEPPAPGTEEWLALQAQSLAEHRVRSEVEPAFEEEEIEPAVPVELPAWLLESMPVEGLTTPEPSPLVEEITPPPQPEGLPDWLSAPTVAAESDLLQLLETAPAAAPAEPPAPAEEPVFDDPWAVALDEEFRHRQRQEEPEWYIAALSESARAAETPAEEAAFGEEAAEEEAAERAEAVPGEVPSWLSDVTVRAEAPAEVAPAEELPDWLADTIPGGAETLLADWLSEDEGGLPELETAAGETPDWLAPVSAEADLPDWLREAAPVQPPTPEPAQEVAPPAAKVEAAPPEKIPPPAPVTPLPRPEPTVARPAVQPQPPTPRRTPMPIRPYLPDGEAYAPLRTRLQANPDDHAARLDLARALDRNGDIPTCLGQYQALVQSEAMLDDVTADLNALVARHPAAPQVRRVLGDALVRQGRLQDALDVYRSALEQL